MVDKLLALHKNSYAVYSNFPVSSIVVTKDGREFVGVNVEDSSYRAGVCAERCAMFSAIAAGVKKGEFKEINIMVSSGEIGEPCFVCRQMLVELFDKDAIVRCYSTKGDYKEFTVSELCPHPFDNEDLTA